MTDSLCPLYDLPNHVPVLVIGAELGGAIAACRLARAGQAIAVMTRNLMTSSLPDLPDDAGAFDPSYLNQPVWPSSVRADQPTRIAAGASRAAAMQGAAPGGTGLVDRYLRDALAHGARLFAETQVASLERCEPGTDGARWRVNFRLPGWHREMYDGPDLFVTADLVILATGGETAQLLLQSQALGLPLGRALVSGLGGCPMGESAALGVVDERGRVYASATGQETHPGLWVMGSAVLPPAAGPATLLTSAAIAERSAELLAQERGWSVDVSPPVGSDIPVSRLVGFRFCEAMRGFFSTKVKDANFQRGVQQGRDDGSRFDFVLTLLTEDVNDLITAADHPARSVGTVQAPALSPRPLTVLGGHFNLFVDQADGSRRMRYRMKMMSTEGRYYFMDGYKVIRDDPGCDIWSDTTTLYITVFDGDSDQTPILGRGILHILPADFAKQMTTFLPTNARTLRQKAQAEIGFARIFLGTLFETYVDGGHFLPDVRRPGGLGRLLASLAGRGAVALVVFSLAVWPYRPSVLRQQPAIAAAAPRGDEPMNIPAEVQALGLFPQDLRDLDLRPGHYRIEHLKLGCHWVGDNVVQTHGGLAAIPFHPADIAQLKELPLRRGFMNLTRVRNEADQVVASGRQVEIAALDSNPFTNTINADTTWTIDFPDGDVLFLSEKEGGRDLGQMQADAKKSGRAWTGERRIHHTLGPLGKARGLIHGGAGAYAGVVGSFVEYNIMHEVPPAGDMTADTEIDAYLLHAVHRGEAPRPPPDVVALGLPGATLNRLDWRQPHRLVHRHFEIRLPGDVLYRSHGVGGPSSVGPDIIPASLGPLPDPAQVSTSVVMARLRDERGDLIGEAGAGRVQAQSGATGSEWTLLLAGEGSIFVVPETGSPGIAPGVLGARPGSVVGGTGIYAAAAGQVIEHWPAGQGTVALDLTLVVPD